MEINPYILVAINGFCTGTGVLTASFLFESIIKPRLKKIHKKVSKWK